MDFYLRDLIREELSALGEVDVSQVAAAVARRVPEEHRDEALIEALVYEIREVRGLYRKRNAAPMPPGTSLSKRSERLKEMTLSERHVISGSGSKALGECTADDLDAIAKSFVRRAEVITQRGERYTTLAKAMRQRKVETVSEMPYSEVAEALDQVVAA